jgi:quercetin dioxygenase-like cupin family protein
VTGSDIGTVVGHVDDATVPWVDGGNYRFKILRAEHDTGIRVLRLLLPAGFRSPRHRHTGHSYGYTVSGAWGYEEYRSRYSAGSLIYEPVGSTHTLTVFADNREETDVVFLSRGANETLDDNDDIVYVTDTEDLLDDYYRRCDVAGVSRPTHIEQ